MYTCTHMYVYVHRDVHVHYIGYKVQRGSATTSKYTTAARVLHEERTRVQLALRASRHSMLNL